MTGLCLVSSDCPAGTNPPGILIILQELFDSDEAVVSSLLDFHELVVAEFNGGVVVGFPAFIGYAIDDEVIEALEHVVGEVRIVLVVDIGFFGGSVAKTA